MVRTAEAEAPSSATSDGGFQETVLGLLQEMSSSIQGLQARVERVEAEAGSHILPRTLEDYTAPGEREQMARNVEPDGIPRSQKIPTFSTGETVNEFVMNQYRPRFGSGMRVRLNLDVVPHGRTDNRTRRELKADDGTPDAIGRVIDHTFLSKRGEWKYRVKFPGKALPGSNGGLSAFYEKELLPA